MSSDPAPPKANRLCTSASCVTPYQTLLHFLHTRYHYRERTSRVLRLEKTLETDTSRLSINCQREKHTRPLLGSETGERANHEPGNLSHTTVLRPHPAEYRKFASRCENPCLTQRMSSPPPHHAPTSGAENLRVAQYTNDTTTTNSGLDFPCQYKLIHLWKDEKCIRITQSLTARDTQGALN